jgi:hypothetical protein
LQEQARFGYLAAGYRAHYASILMASRCEEETVANWSTPRDQLLDRGDCLRRQREKVIVNGIP